MKENTILLIDIEGNALSRGYKIEAIKKEIAILFLMGIGMCRKISPGMLLIRKVMKVFSVSGCESLYTCGEDRYVAKKNGYWALLDTEGKQITDHIWDDIDTADEGLLPVYSAGSEPDFRSVRWGMSEEEVKAVEGGNPKYTGKLDGTSARYIGYDTTLMGNDVILAYYFSNEGLFMARYIWTETHSNDSLYISDYESVRTQLTKKYGSPWYNKET